MAVKVTLMTFPMCDGMAFMVVHILTHFGIPVDNIVALKVIKSEVKITISFDKN